ncbi:hypothetical protein BDZ88DRAFT_180711 [Geranomyces variabilis]|nr:hypothetical protein BDZ88DRAFT_180711 [Geranomyces variabilis]
MRAPDVNARACRFWRVFVRVDERVCLRWWRRDTRKTNNPGGLPGSGMPVSLPSCCSAPSAALACVADSSAGGSPAAASAATEPPASPPSVAAACPVSPSSPALAITATDGSSEPAVAARSSRLSPSPCGTYSFRRNVRRFRELRLTKPILIAKPTSVTATSGKGTADTPAGSAGGRFGLGAASACRESSGATPGGSVPASAAGTGMASGTVPGRSGPELSSSIGFYASCGKCESMSSQPRRVGRYRK